MKIVTSSIKLSTKSSTGMSDITNSVQKCVDDSKVTEGIVVIFCPGSTGAISTIEYEPGLLKDVPLALDRIAPSEGEYHHHKSWHDDNGSGHVRATLIGPSITVPIGSGRLTLGKWQQIVFLECDSKDRDRELVVKIIGEQGF